MVLQSINALHYLRCQRVYVNTDEKDQVRSRSNFDVVVELDQLYEKVQAIELVSWVVPFDMAPTLYEARLGVTANNIIDVFLTNPPGHTAVLTHAVTLQPGGYTSASDLGASIAGQIVTEIDTLGHATYNSTTNAFAVNSSVTDGKISFSATVTGALTPVDLQFLFGSGANAASAPARALGLPVGVDTPILLVGGTDIQGPVGIIPAQMSPWRYVDVNVTGVNYKMARVPLTGPDFVAKRFNKTKFRLLDTPIRRTQEIRAVLTLAGGLEPVTVSTNGYDMVYDYLLLSPEMCIPHWVVQSLQM